MHGMHAGALEDRNAGFHIEKSEQAAEAIDGQVNIPAL